MANLGQLADAVLFDRDGTLVRDVPYNGDPDQVEAMPGAREALDRLRSQGLRLGVVTNQSGVARGLLTSAQVDAVNARVEELLGPFDVWQVCPHAEDAGCGCRKPAPGMIHAAARALGTDPTRCVVVGDIGRDIVAAGAAGALAVLVPTGVTLPAEVAAAPVVAPDLEAAADWVLSRRFAPVPGRRAGGHVLAVRSDSAGDVLLTGPALRALAAGADRLTLLCGPRGEAAADLLPGVDELISWHTPWIDPEPKPVDPVKVNALVDRIAALAVDEAVVFTSFHQSPLPFALLLRLAGVLRISAVSVDYPGSLLDVRHRVDDGLPEAERALSLAAAAGFGLPAGDDGRLAVRRAAPAGVPPGAVVVHPGASVPARACPPERMRETVLALTAAGHLVVVTGGPRERELTGYVAGDEALDLGGRTRLDQLAGVLAGAACLVCANTGPAHLAAAVGTPVVSLFAPTVPFGRWAPYRVPHVRLGDPLAGCRDSRAGTCPVPGHPCLSAVTGPEVVAAVELLVRS
ncbi:MAG: haloacid dehalogenase [Actinobacteria bacterium 13_1_20CM_3_71_11]|nr:MAG: haloacid dehalogenase [Actinobacteria bacterium 13_1_20CM_3_71_11]